MSRPIRRFVARMIPDKTPFRNYIRFAAMLLVVALMGFGYLGLFGCFGDCGDGCDGSSPDNTASAVTPRCKIEPKILASNRYNPGQRVDLAINCTLVAGETVDKVTISWTPPLGATEFQFPADRQPDNIDSGPPFRWTDVPWSQAASPLNVSYVAPPSNDDTYVDQVFDSVIVAGPEGTLNCASHWSTGNRLPSQAGLKTKPLAEPAPDIWRVSRWLDANDNAPLTAETANSLIEALRQQTAFVALKVPGGPIPADGVSTMLPWFADDSHPAKLEFIAWGAGTIYEAELELAFDQMSFLHSQLPTSDGDQWLALVLDPDAPDYDGSTTTGYSVKSTIYLDLANRTSAGKGTVLESYVCFVGEELPPTMSAAACMVGGPELRTYQGYGITAYGPMYQTLLDNPTWELVGTTFQAVAAGDQLEFGHHVSKTGSNFSLDLTITSTLGVGWTAYYGDWEGPNMGQPVNGSLQVNEHPEFFWLVSDSIPSSARDGAYEVYVTGTRDQDSQTVTDLIWVGEWTAPPSGPPTGPVYSVAMPMIVAD